MGLVNESVRGKKYGKPRSWRNWTVNMKLKELGHHISDHDAINSTAILFLPYKEAISLDYCQFTGLWVQ